jgi:FixJ family two-component response regulator
MDQSADSQNQKRWFSVLYLVEDDAVLRNLLQRMLNPLFQEIRLFSSADGFLEAWSSPSPGLLLLDQGLPGMSGLELVERYFPDPVDIPIMLMSGFADVPLAVKAMRKGAIDVLKKPFEGDLVEHIHRALVHAQKMWPEKLERHELKSQMQTLTGRERDVLRELYVGRSNKDIGLVLNISPKTVEIHRKRIMDKLRAESLADLVRRLSDFHLSDTI